MGAIFGIIIIILLILSFFVFNVSIIAAIVERDIYFWKEEQFVVLYTAIMDLVLIFLLIRKIKKPVASSFQLARRGARNRRNEKKEAAKLKKRLKKEKIELDRLEELRQKGINEEATMRTFHFCQLIEAIDGNDQLQDCLSQVIERQGVVDEIDYIENRIFEIAEGYKNAGDIRKCKYYLNLIVSPKKMPAVISLKEECDKQSVERKREKRAVRLWKILLMAVISIICIYYFVAMKEQMQIL